MQLGCGARLMCDWIEAPDRWAGAATKKARGRAYGFFGAFQAGLRRMRYLDIADGRPIPVQ